MSTIVAVCNVLLGCCLNVVSLEYVAKFDTGAGHLLTFVQFLFIVLMCLCWPTIRAVLTCQPRPPMPFTTPLTLPLRAHMQMAATFFALSSINNKTLDYKIAMPLHMIFRSSSLVTTLLVGWLFWKRQYVFGQWMGCFLVSVGIFVTTIADALSQGKLSLACCGWGGSSSTVSLSQSLQDSLATIDVRLCSSHCCFVFDDFQCECLMQSTWLTGVLLLTVALLLTSFLSFVQEQNFKAHGKNAEGTDHLISYLLFSCAKLVLLIMFGFSTEALLYSHMLSLPYFLFFADDIVSRFQRWTTLAPITMTFFQTEVQVSIWYPLLFNAFSQYLCIAAVFRLMSTFHCPVLCVTLSIISNFWYLS
jgi:UDP-xylose/UDP-N-acetylglucosamine transporter B4